MLMVVVSKHEYLVCGNCAYSLNISDVGGGGRIAIYASTMSLLENSLLARGGSPGTIYIESDADPYLLHPFIWSKFPH